MDRHMIHAAQRLGPLPARVRTYNRTDLTAGARRAFLAAGDPRRPAAPAPAVPPQPEARAKGETWYRLENLAGAEPVLYLYGEIGCWGITASDLIEELKYITAPQLTVHLSSPGGEIFEGIAVYNALRSHPAYVTIRVDSLAASIASVILQAGDLRIMQPFSQAMIHEGSGLCWGDAADMLKMATLLDRSSDNIAAVYAEHAGGTPEAWREQMRVETWYTADETVAAGLADEVDAAAPAEPPAAAPAAPAPAAMWDLSAFKHAGREHAPDPILNTAATVPPATEPPVDGEHEAVPGDVLPEVPTAAYPVDAQPLDPPPAHTEGAPETPDVTAVAATEEPATEPDTATPDPATGPDAWATVTAQLLAPPTWDSVTASLREASK